MDPVTSAIMAVIPDLAADTLKDAVKSAYDGLKAVIHRKWGEAAPISKAIRAAEEDPTSTAQAAVVAEKVAATKADKDTDVIQALQSLVAALQTHSSTETVARLQLNITGGTQTGLIGVNSVTANTLSIGNKP